MPVERGRAGQELITEATDVHLLRVEDLARFCGDHLGALWLRVVVVDGIRVGVAIVHVCGCGLSLGLALVRHI